MNESGRRLYPTAAACVAWFGVLLQCCLSLKLATDKGQTLAAGLAEFLGYFTVLTNVLVCAALTVPRVARASAAGRFFASPFAVAGITASIVFVAISYHFLLRHVWSPRGAQWVADVDLHYAVPALFLTYWFLYRRTGSLRWVDSLWWSLYPMAYFLYVLVRGAVVGRYPYGFIDAGALGYGRTTVNAFGLLFGFIVLGLLVVGVDRVGRRAIR